MYVSPPDDADELHENDDPIASVDSLLASEMLALDLKDRIALQEEMHGIGCFVTETPEKVETALVDLSDEVARIPASEKTMFLRSQDIPGSLIQSTAFRVRILRVTSYNIQVAARKLVQICDVMVDLFGEIALKRPIRLSDFSKKDLQLFRLGRYQLLPFGDRFGRRIFVLFCDEVWESMPPMSRARISFYTFWCAGQDDDSQVKGINIVGWFDKAFKVSRTPKIAYQDHKVCTVRVCSIHFCAPDTPDHRFRITVATMRIGRSRRIMRAHHGDSMENRYSLQSFGIAADQIPISYSGKIKLTYIRQWMGIRRIIEDAMDIDKPVPPEEVLIEFPLPDDVVFRQGSSCAQHSANRAFRNLIIAKVQEQELSKNITGMKIRRKKMVLEIIDSVRETGRGRFLIWNDNGGWNILLDEEVIHSKIEYLIKEFRKSVRRKMKQKPQTILSAETMMFRSDYNMQDAGVPFDLEHEIDENQLVEAACCVANCFGMKSGKSPS